MMSSKNNRESFSTTMKHIFNFNITTLLSLIVTITLGSTSHMSAFSPQSRVATSKLATGRWVKVKVNNSGIYAITNSDIKKWGFSNLTKVHVFGFGGAPISEILSDQIPDDLPQVPTLRSGDRILFYAQGPTTWKTQRGDLSFLQEQHPYARAGYYFITDQEQYGDLSVTKLSNSATGQNITNTFTERIFHEQEIVNPGETGRELLGEDFRYNNTQGFKFDLAGMLDNTKVVVQTQFAAKSGSPTKVSFQYNGTNLPSTEKDNIANSSNSHVHYITSTSSKTFNLAGTHALTYTVNYASTSTPNLARLNYITVNYKRDLALDNGKIAWGDMNGGIGTTYRVAGASSATHIWDVTTSHTPVAMNTTLNGATAQFSPATGGYREYIAFNDNASFPAPEMVAQVGNQNLHAEPTPDMIIIAPTEFLAQASRVAQLHESTDSMRVLVVDQNKIFNEFSSGTPDYMAYRMLCKHFYDRGADEKGHKLGYLLLMGNGSYDNRQISSAVKTSSHPMLLTWQTKVSNTENASYSSDDPVAVLSDNSGPVFENYDLDIAVGRFPVKTLNEAKVAVDKLIAYVTKPNNTSWKNNFLDVADDEEYARFMEQSDTAISLCKKNGGNQFVYNKVYLDAFTAQSQGAGRFYPDARNKMFRLLEEGIVWWNYMGHAGPYAWTGEGLLSKTDVAENLYYRRLPILYTATCEFTRYDAIATSCGESVFLNPQGGAIALVSTPRLVYIEQNSKLRNHTIPYIFKRDAQGHYNRLGDIVRLGKNSYRQSTASKSENNNARYFLFGDPAMRPALPTHKIKINTINGQAIAPNNMPVFKARQTLTFAGEVLDPAGNKVNFNGPIIATLYDCEKSVVTHGYGTDGKEYAFQDRSNKLAVKLDTVRQGEFSFSITVPSEIVATVDNFSPSLINLYAYDNHNLDANKWNGGSVEAMGANSNFFIYGYDDTVKADTIGPNIGSLGLNSQEFKDGDKVNESPLLLASIDDASGINLSTSGIGHSMTITLDEKTTFNDVATFFSPITTQNGSNAGTITYQLKDLKAGHHSLRLKVWDVFNNSSEKTISFNVVTGLKPNLVDVYTDANPASTEANFFIKHNRPEASLTVKIEVYDLMGREVWSTTQKGRSDMFTSFPITWNLTNKTGARVPRGIYVYRASVSSDGVHESSKAKKIAVTD